MFWQGAQIICITAALPWVHGCVDPTGLGTNVSEIDPDTLSIPDGGIFASSIETVLPYLGEYETPIQFRLVQLVNFGIFNSMAAYEELSLDYFGRITESESRRRCSDNIDTNLFKIHRQVSLAYVLYFGSVAFFPDSTSDANGLLNSFGLDSNICDSYNCDDITTPWGLSYTIVQEVIEFSKYDGWNSDGSLSRDYNKIPYSDFRNDPYIPINSPYRLTNTENWQPLLESDEKGFLFYQQHVVSHIGFTGKSILLGDDAICERESYDPNYDYDQEMELTLDRLAELTDEEKVEIEFFDSKLTSIVPLLVQFYQRQNISLDSFDFLWADSVGVNVLYECIMIVWKEKIKFDRVRPPSIIHKELDGQYITSYAGRTQLGETFGTQTFLANDWEPYIRTMPHSEYPSASACVCAAFAKAMIEITGTDDVTNIIGGPLVEIVSAFSSVLEPLSTPENVITLTYNSWSNISYHCGESRLNGGMHFTESVEAGQTLCGDVGIIIAESFENIINGIVPDYVVDINDQTIPDRDCDTRSSSSSSESSSSH